jgi:hypothetical protein
MSLHTGEIILGGALYDIKGMIPSLTDDRTMGEPLTDFDIEADWYSGRASAEVSDTAQRQVEDAPIVGYVALGV